MNFKKLFPHLIAIVSFLIIIVIYFNPVFFKGKEIRQGDIINFNGVSKEISDFRKDHPGEEPLWTNSVFGGMPAYQISVYYPSNLIRYVDKAFLLNLPYPGGMVFLYFIGFYILLMCLRVNPWLAIIGAIAYGFSSYFFIIIEAGHASKAHAIGYIAPLLGSVILTLRSENKLLGASLTALFTALELNANHLQITYYLFMLLLILFMVEGVIALRNKTIKNLIYSSVVLLMAAILGLLPNITNLWATYEYGKFSTRGKTELTQKANKETNNDIVTSGLDKNYATQWSYGKSETFTLLIPNFKGGASEAISKTNKNAAKKVDPQMRDQVQSMQSYFGDQPFTSGPVYAGAIMIFLAFLALLILDTPLKWTLFIGTLLSITLAWGKNFMWLSNIFFDYFPGYNKFRAVSMMLVIAELTIPLLAVLALEKLIIQVKSLSETVRLPFLKKEVSIEKSLIIAFSVVGGFVLLCLLMPTLFNSFERENELNEIVNQVKQQNPKVSIEEIQNAYAPLIEQTAIARKAIFTSDAWRSFVLILLAAGLIWLYLKQKLSKNILLAALGAIVLFDMWDVASRYLNKENYVSKGQNQSAFSPSKADEFILADTSPDYRVLKLGNPFNDASTSYYHKSIGGYHGAKLKRYQELVDFHIDREYDALIRFLNSKGVSDSSLQAFMPSLKILNMLNTKYIIYNEEAPPIVNLASNGHAWMVNNIKFVNSADEEINALYNENPLHTAIVNKKFEQDLQGLTLQPTTNARINMLSYKPNHLVYESESAVAGVAVFSEIYYPKGWNAYVDGQLTNHFGVNYVLRGMKIPAGKHKIEFKFEPQVYYTGERISLFGSIFTILAVVAGIVLTIRQQKKLQVL